MPHRHRHRPRTPRTPRAPRTSARSQPSSARATTKAEWDQLCEITAHRILRNGFVIEYLHAMTSVALGGELDTGVVLIVSAGNQSVRNVRHTEAGVSEGLIDMAQDGLDGRMILYGLAFCFMPAGLGSL